MTDARFDAEPLSRDACVHELQSIANWWLENTLDTESGGFKGEVDYFGQPVAKANKGIVLNSRILWFFSETALLLPEPKYRLAAERAFEYLLDHFDDTENGGVYWELACDGSVVNDKKQTYALCFCIYALTAYYQLTSNPLALEKALDYFNAIEAHARDRQHSGYVEALSRDWQTLDDVRLSELDMNAPKTMNTHLHLVEAYTALHRVAGTEQTAAALRDAVDLFCEHIIDQSGGHLNLFFDDHWKSLSTIISFGHDIESSWLLWEAGECLDDAKLVGKLKPIVKLLADTCLREGVGAAHHVCNEYNPDSDRRSDESIWWVQAEALVGFLNAWQLSGEPHFRTACDNIWRFVRKYHIDTSVGEWHWLSTVHDSGKNRHYKAGFWKGPYHNGRAMIEICKRLNALELA